MQETINFNFTPKIYDKNKDFIFQQINNIPHLPNHLKDQIASLQFS